MDECVLCGIASGNVSSKRVWQNEEFLAVLDVFPKIEGQLLVFPRKHHDSDVLKLPDEFRCRFVNAAAQVSGLMVKSLGCGRVTMIAEGLELDHAHLKLFPVYNRSSYAAKITKAGKKAANKELEIIHNKFN